MTLHVVGITRFALVNTRFLGSYPLTRAANLQEAQAVVFAPERMSARFAMWRALALRSVVSMARPDNVRLRYIIATSAELPDQWRAALQSAAQEHPECSLLEIPADVPAYKAIADSTFGDVGSGDVFTFRLDDDDALASDYVVRVKRWFDAGGRGVLSFTSGIYLRQVSGGWRYEHRTTPRIAIGLGSLCEDRKTIYDLGNHMKIRNATYDGSPSMWLRTMHAYNSSGVPRRAGELIGPDTLRERLAQAFPRLDPQAVMVALSDPAEAGS